VNGINYTFATDGEYSWNVECTNNASVTNSSPLNYSLGIDSSTPAVTLVSPANGNVTNDSSTIAFKFNVTDETVSLLSCSLFLNDSLYASNSSVLNATLTAFSVSVANGNWTWNVSCADAAGNSNSSNRSIEVNVAASFTFSNVRVEDIRGTSAVVKFDTSVATTDWVWLSLYSNFSPSTNTSVNDTLSSTHSVVLSGLSFSTTYHYRACGADAYGAEACSSVGSFTTTGGGPQPTPTPSPSIEPSTEPSVEPSVEPSPTPSASPTPSVSVTPTPSVEPSVQPRVGPGEGGDETVVTVVGGSELSEGTGAVSECNSTVCRAGESAKVVVRRTIEVVQTPKGVLTRVKLRVSNEGKAAAFGVSVSEFVDSLAKGERVDYSLAPDSFFEGGAEWVIDVLPPGESREFAYAVFRRATLSEVGGSRPPVVFVRSAGAVSASLDYSLFYAAAALIAAAALARTALFFKQKREKRKKD
jgi:hypothetical protein